ncbi:sugar kinase [Paenibacillus soyae]|uniref:Sugar kinase n=1 Tax=Paenibacillus soyae TaxID=2969249 RepID=A0A9X2MMY3_9BACL|nr:sugar kinase [Paenibacillus soyae]MCR2802683.1 sugar kinase [Paenibacillus soyae]
MPTKLDVVTFGESMGLITPDDGRSLETTQRLTRGFGGAESNTAIGLARLGIQVGWFGHLGDDSLGRSILKQIRGEGVDTSRVRLNEYASTGLMLREVLDDRLAVHYYRSGSAASRMTPNSLDEAYIAQAGFLHLTGITAAISASARATVHEAIRMAKKHGVKVIFDPNIRLKLWSIEEARPILLELAKEADYFLPGLDELKLLYETDELPDMLNRIAELNAISVIKGGDNCSYLVEKNNVTAVPFVRASRVVDTVGAGDAFCAGFITGLVWRKPLEECVKLASLLGSLIVQVNGDWEGLPSRRTLQAKLDGNANHIER